MKSILQRILKHVSGVAHVAIPFAQVRGGRFDEWPEPTVDPYTVHAMCFPPPRYWAERSERDASPMKLQNKVCIVTGAASGIGKAIAARFAREGGKVAVADLQIEAAHRTVAEIEAAGGVATALAMDVTNEEQVRAGVAHVVAKWGGVDVLVSNAGIQIVHPIESFPFAEWKRMLAIHLDGAFLTTQACIPHMQRSGRGGSIVYIGSVHSKEASVLKSAYVTAKHGLIGLAKTVAKEGARFGIRANVVCPGFVRTPLVEKQIPEQARELAHERERRGEEGDAQGDGRRRVHDRRRRRRGDLDVRELSLERAYRAIDGGEPRLVHAMNQPRVLSIACLAGPMNRHRGVRHFMTGVLIGAAVLVVVFVLV